MEQFMLLLIIIQDVEEIVEEFMYWEGKRNLLWEEEGNLFVYVRILLRLNFRGEREERWVSIIDWPEEEGGIDWILEGEFNFYYKICYI